MNIIGTWKVAEVQDILNKTWRTAEDITADAAAPDYLKEGLAYRYNFTEDGQMQVLLRSADYYDAGPLGFGYSDPEAWNNMGELLKEMGMVSGSDFAAAFSNEFIPE